MIRGVYRARGQDGKQFANNREKEENQEGKATSGSFFFTLPLLTGGTGYVTVKANT